MNITPLISGSDKNLYEQVADRLQAMIVDGTLQPGDRLPSVRKLRQQFSISISTAQEAYRVLEDRGLISARPQSGYYVKRSIPNQLAEPSPSNPPWRVNPVDSSLVYQVQTAIRDPDIVKLGAAVPSPDLFPGAALNRLMGQVMRANFDWVHSYDVAPGCETLRRQVSKRLMDAGCAVSPDQIITTNGAHEAVYLSLSAVTKPGDTVAIESPCSYGFLEALEALHLNALELPTYPQEGVSLKHLEDALSRQQISVFLMESNFSNPLCSCMSDAKKKRLVALINQYEIPLIEDDVHGDLNFEGTRPKAVKAFDTEGRVLYCSSISKTLSPGLRVGWAIPGRYQRKVERLKIALNETTAIAPQLTVAAFFANGGYDRHLRQLRKTYRTRVEQMTQAIQSYFPAETRVTRPKGSHVLWIELPPPFDAMQLYKEALGYRISIAPGHLFSPSKGYSNCFRLNCGFPWSEEIDRALQTLGSLVKKQMAVHFLNDMDAIAPIQRRPGA